MTTHIFISTEDCYPLINDLVSGESVYPCKYPSGSWITELNQPNVYVITGSKFRSDIGSGKSFDEATDIYYDMSAPKDNKILGIRLIGRRLNTTATLLAFFVENAPVGTKFYLVQHGDNSHCIQYLKDQYNLMTSREDRYTPDDVLFRFGNVNNDNYEEIIETSFNSSLNTYNVSFSVYEAPTEYVNLSKNTIFGSGDNTDTGMTCRVFTKS